MRGGRWLSLAIVAACGASGPVEEEGREVGDRRSHAVGVQLGVRLAEMGVPVDAEWIVAGLRAAGGGHDEPGLDGEQVRRELDDLAARARETAGQAGAAAVRARVGEAGRFLAANRERPGVVTLPSGVQYRVLEEGAGPPPALDDRITVDYEARLLDGAVFDASSDRFTPTIMRLRRAPAAWQEVLPRVPRGGRVEIFWSPGPTAEGGHAMGLVPPGELITFTVRVVGVDRPHAAAETPPSGRGPPHGKEPSS